MDVLSEKISFDDRINIDDDTHVGRAVHFELCFSYSNHYISLLLNFFARSSTKGDRSFLHHLAERLYLSDKRQTKLGTTHYLEEERNVIR